MQKMIATLHAIITRLWASSPQMRAAALRRYGRYGGGGWGYPGGGWWWGGPTYSGNIGQGFCPDCWDDKGNRQDPLPGPTPFPPSVNDQVSKGWACRFPCHWLGSLCLSMPVKGHVKACAGRICLCDSHECETRHV